MFMLGMQNSVCGPNRRPLIFVTLLCICTCISYIFIFVFHIFVLVFHIFLFVCINYFCLYFKYFYLYFTHFYLDFRFTYLCWTSTNRSSVQFPPAPSPPIKSLWQTTQQDNGHWARGVQSTKNMNSPLEVSFPKSTSKGSLQKPNSR